MSISTQVKGIKNTDVTGLRIKKCKPGVALGAFSLQHWAVNRSVGLSGDNSWLFVTPEPKKTRFRKRRGFRRKPKRLG